MHQLNGRELTPMQVLGVARRLEKVSLAKDARDRIRESTRALRELRASGREIYGVTTGVGALDTRGQDETSAAARSLLRSHAAGVGPAMATGEVRAMLLVRANNLAHGLSGVRLEVIDLWLALLNRNIVPVVPRDGSIGISDLAPLAHAALSLTGEGNVITQDGEMEATAALQRVGLLPMVPEPRDALGLINGLAHTVGLGALVVADAQRLLWVATETAAMSLAAIGTTGRSFDPRIVAAKNHPGSVAIGRRLARLLEGCERYDESLREPVSSRAAHHILGALFEVIRFAEGIVTIELNAAVDNPMIAADGWSTNNAGNFDSTHLAVALGQLTSSLAAVGATIERRIARLLSGSAGLPPFLVHPRAPSGSSGAMVAHYTAVSCLAELRTLGAPVASFGSDVSAGTEDYAALAPLAARQAARALELTTDLVAIELLCATQALDLRGRIPVALRHQHAHFRERIAVMVSDRILSSDIAATRQYITDPDSALGA